MADVEVTKEPEEVYEITVSFDDVLADWEDVASVEIEPYKLIGANPESYSFDISDAQELVFQQRSAGELSVLNSFDILDFAKVNIEIFASEDPVDAPEIYKDNSLDKRQKAVKFKIEGGENQIDYLIQVNVTSTEDTVYSKEVQVSVERE